MNLFKKLTVSCALLLSLAIVAPSFAVTATVDVDKVLFEYNKAKTIAAQFKAQEEGLQNMLIEDKKKKKEKASPIKKKKHKEVYDKKIKTKAEKIKNEQMKKLKEIENDVMSAIEKVNDGQYDLILKKSATIYCQNDITDAVLGRLNGTSKK